MRYIREEANILDAVLICLKVSQEPNYDDKITGSENFQNYICSQSEGD